MIGLGGRIRRVAGSLRREARKIILNVWLKNPWKYFSITMQQSAYLDSLGVTTTKRVIIFIAPGYNIVNGGVMSIISLAEETERLRETHGADVFVCPMLGDPPLMSYTKFPNNRHLVEFIGLLKRYKKNSEVLIHIPEFQVQSFLRIAPKLLANLNHKWFFNILLQNIDYIPKRNDVVRLAKIGPVTVTTAHDAYSGTETEKILGCPVHHFSVWVSPEQYIRKPFSEREDIFVLSPDYHEKREEVINTLKHALPNFRFVTVQGMTYPEYKNLISVAKFSLTFGEGLDGYYAEIIFSGGIGSAVFNSKFFTPNFERIPFVYSSWDDLLLRLPADVHTANAPGLFENANCTPFQLLADLYSRDGYQKNILAYYKNFFLSTK